MTETKETESKIDFVKWFSELNKDSGNVAGGKGANLAEIYNLKVPVPPGFVVTADAYTYFIKKSNLDKKIEDLLAKINYEDTKKLDKITKEIRESIINSKFPKEMEEEILDSYENLDTREVEEGNKHAHELLQHFSEPIFVAVRSSATTEDLAEASFAGQQDSFLNIKGQSDLIKHIKKCFASLFTSRATYYRNKKGFKHKQAKLAVVVQKMVDSDKSGVIFSKDPSYKNNNIIIEAVWGLGEGIVSGKITPDIYKLTKDLKIEDKKIADKKIAITRDSGGNKEIVKLREEKSKHQVLKEHELKKLSELAIKLEEHYKKPQDIEFAIEGEEIYIVQTRPITTIEKRIESGSDSRKQLKGEVILDGLAASPGIASGKIKIINNLEDLSKIKQGDILVTKMTNPDMVVTMHKSAAIVTDDGGLTAHAAIVSREMGIPAVVGTQKATTKLKENEIITVDGFTGKIYKGKTSEEVRKEVLPVTAKTKTEIKVIVDLPSIAEHAAKSKIKKVGLTRIEGIIAESGKHPEHFEKKGSLGDYEEIIFKGIKKIAQHFEELWIRTSDIRSDEFSNLEGAPEEKEANPMLGLHGIRYSLKNPEIFKSELKALKRISETGKTIGLILPQVISVKEVQETKKIIKEIGFEDSKIGIMIETPASVQLIRELCEEGIDFISFGTNDLTQYILAVDRGNEKVQHLYDEMNPAILYQLEYVIRVCRRKNITTSICGQAGSKKPMVKYLVEKGINSISVNADVASEIAEYVAEIENSLVKGTDKEPRQYQPEEKTKEKAEVKEHLPPQITNKQDPEPSTPEKIKQDVKAIEQEKQAYLKKHPEEKKEYEKEKEAKPETKEEIIEEIKDSGVPEKIAEKEESLDEKEQKLEENENPEFVSEEDIEKEFGEPPDKDPRDPEENEKEDEVLDIF